MPKIKITEIDNTGVVSQQAIANTVYIPGEIANGGEKSAPKLFITKKAFNDATDYEPNCLSHRLAEHLLDLGMYVLYEGVEVEDDVPVIDWDKLIDKTLYDIRFLTTGQFASPSQKMIQCAAKRGDCIALLDHPQDTTTLSQDDTFNSVVEKVRAFFDAFKTVTVAKADAPSFAAAFTPWFKSTNETLLAEDEDVADIPASFGYLFAYANSLRTYPEWYAVAGSFRGIINELVDVDYAFTSSDIEILQARSVEEDVDLDELGDNVGNAINPIAMVRPFGYIVYGNRTFKTNDGDTKATSFLNVRNLVCAVKKALYNAARKYTFEQNSNVLWINFQAQITPLLDKMKSGNGIFGYRFTRIQTDKKARLKARLTIIPIEAVEDFELEVELADSLEVAE